MLVPLTALLSALLCGAYLVVARRWKLFAQPTERGSHTRPTPHGGGLPMLLAFLAAMSLASVYHGPWDAPLPLLAAAAGLLLCVGVWDDLCSLPASVRMYAYAGVCLGFAALSLPQGAWQSPLMALLVVLVGGAASLWLVNLYNFMDGIDGIAAVQAIVACCVAWWLAEQAGAAAYARFCALLAAVHAGFLVWNWPPARLFMGDAGSVPTGFLLAGLALTGVLQGYLPLACWLILLACFIVDATWTLLWRMASGQAFTRAHRLHAYQRLSRHWMSHGRVDLLLLAILLLWLVPLAVLAARWPQLEVFLVFLAYLPLLAGMAKTMHIK